MTVFITSDLHFGHSKIVENRHGNKSVHNVSKEVLEMQANRFAIKLK